MRAQLTRRIAPWAILMACMAAVSLPAEAASKPASTLTALIQGTTADGSSTFTGSFAPTSFSEANGVLVANGTLLGSVVDSTGNSLGSVNQSVQMLVSSIDPTCQILTLTLGPLDLNVLGLVVNLNQVVLTVTAQNGNGNLLGNLLCAVANLLNGGAPFQLSQIASLLNQILAVLSAV